MFLNFSNHASKNWSEEQSAAARKYGEIVDFPFPQVDSKASTEEVRKLAHHCVEQMIQMHPECVLCQGEFCLSYQVINELKQAGIKVVAACSDRKAEEIQIDNATRKVSYFVFVQFREY